MSDQQPVETKDELARGDKGAVGASGSLRLFRTIWKRLTRALSVLANLSVFLGIVFAVYQIGNANRTERRRFAVEATRQTKAPEFIKSLRQMKEAYETKRVDEKDKDSLIDSINYVMNVYDDIAVVYINDIADRCIIKDSIDSRVREAAKMRDALAPSAPKEDKHLTLFLTLMSNEPCEGSHLSPTK